MFDLGWTELLVIGIVALIVVGPKDLPILFQQVGKFVGKAKGMAREFSRAMNQAADDAGMSDAASTFRSATDGLNNVTNPVGKAADALKEHAKAAAKWDPDSETGKLAAKRAEAAKKIHEATAKKAQERLDAEAEAVTESPAAQASDAPADDTKDKT